MEISENTFSTYLGPEFQQRLMWQLLVEPEFAEKIIIDLAIEYFDDPNLKRLFIIILEYYKEYQKVPNLQNRSIHQAINEFKAPNNPIEEESLFSVVKRIELWNERVINKQMLYDGDIIQKSTHQFIKQQEYRKLAESIIDKVKNGEIKNKYIIADIEEKFQKISHIGENDDDSEEVIEEIDRALRKEFRRPIPTGIGAIDVLTGGGLGRGEIGVILSPSGVGKTTALTIIANTAYEVEKNVAQIIFEDTKDQIKRKHYTIWAKSSLSKLSDDDDEIERVKQVVKEKVKQVKNRGRLIIKRFSQENVTMMDIRNWMLSYQKKYGFKFDILILDYLDCLESHKKVPDRNEAELAIIKSFEALASEFDIPAWTAIQTNRSGFGAEFIEAQQSGGNIKRVQKAHFFMSIAKTQEQKEAQLANISILKARFAQDGQRFEDCIFNNDKMQIIIDDPRYKNTKIKMKHYDNDDILKLENKVDIINANDSSILSEIHGKICEYETEKIKKITESSINSNTIGDVLLNTQILNNLPEKNWINDDNQNDYLGNENFKDAEILTNENFETNKNKNSHVNEDEMNSINFNDKIDITEEQYENIEQKKSDINEMRIRLNDSIGKNELSEIPINNDFEEDFSIKFGIINPDEPDEQEKRIRDELAKLRKNQDVIKPK